LRGPCPHHPEILKGWGIKMRGAASKRLVMRSRAASFHCSLGNDQVRVFSGALLAK
jgi:hypothetical protein